MKSDATIIPGLRKIVAKLTQQVAAQADRISCLELEPIKAKKDSLTSSKSSSSDIIKPSKKKTDRQKKFKKGHKRQLREPLPPE